MGVYEMTIQEGLRQWSSSTLHKSHRELGEEAANRIDELEAVLRYYRDECSGYEPSISVFQRWLDEVLSK
jgi:hypothetical protein